MIDRLFLDIDGVDHVAMRRATGGSAASKGVLAPQAAVIISGAILLPGGASVATGHQPVIGTLLLTIFLVPIAFWMHNVGAESDPITRVNQMAHFLTNPALTDTAWALLCAARSEVRTRVLWPMCKQRRLPSLEQACVVRINPQVARANPVRST